nr:hypothetical protein [Tanacetum cinerariifolium]
SQVAPTPPPSPIAPPSSPPQQQKPLQPSYPTTLSMDLLHTLLETCTTLTRRDTKVAKDADVQERLEESQAQVYHIDLEHADKVLSMQDDKAEPAKLTEVVTTAKLMTKVVTAAAFTITVAPSAARRRKWIVIRDPKETATPSTIVHSEPKSKDKGKGILVEEPKPLKNQAQIEKDKAYARKPIFEKYSNSNVAFLEKNEKELEEEASRELKRKSKSSEKKAAKKQKLDEEVKELKKHLQIVPNDEDDVYTEATPLALKQAVLTTSTQNVVAVLTYLPVSVDAAALGELCLEALTDTLPEFVIIGVGTKFLLGSGIIVHQKNEAVFKEDIAFLKYDVKVRDNSITELKNRLEKSLKEKDDLKLKLENFETSSKNITKDKTGLGYDSQLIERDLSNKSDVLESASNSSVNESEEDNNQANDRYKTGKGYHVVPPLYTGNFMPPRPDLSFAGLDDFVFKSAISDPITSVHETKTNTSNTSKESIEKPKTVRLSAPITKD